MIDGVCGGKGGGGGSELWGGCFFGGVAGGVGMWARMGWDLVVVAGYPAFAVPKHSRSVGLFSTVNG